MPAAAFYVSGHGFGHASRQIEILNALGARLPSLDLVVRTSVPRWLFDRTARVPFRFVDGPCDTGVVQFDSLRLDEDATAREARRFYATWDERVAVEAARLHDHGVSVVVCDAPPLGCAAAAAAGVPSVVISNFTWDWIYGGYADRFASTAPDVIPLVRDAYREARAGWRLPMHGGFETVVRVEDLPFVARRSRASREDVLRRLRLPADRPLALSSFGGYGLEGFDPSALDCRDRWTVVITTRDPLGGMPPGVAAIEEAAMYGAGLRYEDLVAACDVVVTKPGYGIVSECIANGTAVLYTSRGRFVEYDVLVAEMPRYVRSRYIEQDALRAGRWLEALDALVASPAPPERPLTDGAEVAARKLAALISPS